MFIDECVEPAGWVHQNISQSFVDSRTSMLHLVEHSFQYNNVFACVFLENINLVEYNVGIQQQIVWLLDKLAFRDRVLR